MVLGPFWFMWVSLSLVSLPYLHFITCVDTIAIVTVADYIYVSSILINIEKYFNCWFLSLKIIHPFFAALNLWYLIAGVKKCLGVLTYELNCKLVWATFFIICGLIFMPMTTYFWKFVAIWKLLNINSYLYKPFLVPLNCHVMMISSQPRKPFKNSTLQEVESSHVKFVIHESVLQTLI